MKRRLALTLAAFIVGAAAGAAIVFEGSPAEAALRSAPGGAPVLVVEVENVGTRDARATLDLSAVGGGQVAREEWIARAGETSRFTAPQGTEGSIVVSLAIRWAEEGRSGSGSTRELAHLDDCDGGTLRVTFRVDTSNGVAFPGQRRTSCS